MRKALPLLLLMTLLGCTTPYVDPGMKLTTESDYMTALEKFTIHKQVYDGLNATLDFHIYFLNSYLSKYQIDQNARIYQWNSGQYEAEKEKSNADLSKQTTYILSFFTPDRHNDDLNKEKTKWRVFLDEDGHRYEAKVEKIKLPFSEMISLYPQHNRWSSLYKLTFPTPSAVVEAHAAKISITGPVGHAEAEFPTISDALGSSVTKLREGDLQN